MVIVEMFLFDLFLERGLVAPLGGLLFLDRLPCGVAEAAGTNRDREASD
jgi:hypothetical protein